MNVKPRWLAAALLGAVAAGIVLPAALEAQTPPSTEMLIDRTAPRISEDELKTLVDYLLDHAPKH